jgi:radical SAM superfamily enzyme YgiQ (UPF0313 family)
MRIALINARMSWSSVVPTGLLSIATVLKEDGHQVKVFDAYYPDDELLQRILIFQPNLAGISFMTTEYPRAKDIINGLRRTLKNISICAGGYHVSALPERSLKELPIDFVVISEGEKTMSEICKHDLGSLDLQAIKGVAYLDDYGNFVKTQPREFISNLDDLPIIDRELLDGGMDWYLTLPGNIRGHLVERCTTIITSRGCPGNCLFCSSRAMWTNRVRQRSSDNVLEEIEYLHDRYGIKGLFFLDDTFTANKNWVIEFCNKWEKRGLKLTWGCSARVNTISDEMLASMKSIGCVQLDFGVESGNDKVLKTLHKGQNKQIILKAFDLVHKYGLNSLACFIIGNPGETEFQMLETLEVAKAIKPSFAIFSILTPLPGSPLYDMAIKNNWISGDEDFDMRWSIRHSEMPVMGIEISPKRLLEIRKKFEDKFFYTNYLHYAWPLIKHPKFILMLLFQVVRKLKKYMRLIIGKETRQFSGFIESIYYDYKEYSAQRIAKRKR